MTNEQKVENYLKARDSESWVTIYALCIMLSIRNSCASRILREFEQAGVVESQRVTTKGRGQPTLAFRWLRK
jgi:ribosomal protein S25